MPLLVWYSAKIAANQIRLRASSVAFAGFGSHSANRRTTNIGPHGPTRGKLMNLKRKAKRALHKRLTTWWLQINSSLIRFTTPLRWPTEDRRISPGVIAVPIAVQTTCPSWNGGYPLQAGLRSPCCWYSLLFSFGSDCWWRKMSRSVRFASEGSIRACDSNLSDARS